MHSAPASPVYAFTHAHMSWQLQPLPGTLPWSHSPHSMPHPGTGFGGGGYMPISASPRHQMSQPSQQMTHPGHAAGAFSPALQPPPPPVFVRVMERPATSPAPLGVNQHSPQHSDRGSHWEAFQPWQVILPLLQQTTACMQFPLYNFYPWMAPLFFPLHCW